MNLSESQKNVIYVWLICAASILFAHNPTEGYVDAYGNENGISESTHSRNQSQQRDFCNTTYEGTTDWGAFGKSSQYKTICKTPVIHLYSKAAIFDWPSKVSNALIAFIFISFLSAVALFWLKNRSRDSS
jgi:hypothetical protein